MTRILTALPPVLRTMAGRRMQSNIFSDIGINPLSQLINLYHNKNLDPASFLILVNTAKDASDMRVRTTATLMLYSYGITSSNLCTHSRALASEINAIRSNPKFELTRRLLRLLPKADLHCHLDGSVRERMIAEHAERQGIVLADDPGVKQFIPEFPRNATLADIKKYARLKADAANTDFLRFLLAGFALPLAVMQDRIALENIAYDAIAQAHDDGVLHIELRYAPCLHTEKGLTYDEIGEAIMQGLIHGERDFGVSSTLVACIYRDKVDTALFGDKYVDHPIPTAESAVRLAKRYPERVALDLVGYETPYPPENYLEAFAKTFDTDVFRTVHAGEPIGTGQNIMKAVDLLLADRIGHGIQVNELSCADRQKLKDKGIVFEVSVKSNHQLGTIASGKFSDHPLLKMLRDGFRVSMATDNRTVSDITLTDQIRQIGEKETGLDLMLFDNNRTSPELRALLANSMGGAFAPRVRRIALQREFADLVDVVDYLAESVRISSLT
ncbi:adenosine deaminase family protein [Candidatus Saganbacteria bacterium]|nr:adenosine deaminase family protein [Candidatus Saganbacteria bacterium]